MPERSQPITDEIRERSVRHAVARTTGEILITLGALAFLFVVYLVWVTDLEAARKQQAATAELRRSWSAPAPQERTPRPTGTAEPAKRLPEGDPFARLYVPRFGEDYAVTVLQGVTREVLDAGLGHYPHSALPGKPGNFAVAGHRLGNGGPFNRLGELRACDPIVIETADQFVVYRVLPIAREPRAGNAENKGKDACANDPLWRDGTDRGAYREVRGRRIVTPDRVDAVAPVPYRSDRALAPERRRSLVTLTTCHPEYGNSERLIIHGALTDREPKSDTRTYPRLLQRLREDGS